MQKYQCASLYHPGISLLRKLKLLMQKYPNFSVKVWLQALPAMLLGLFQGPKKNDNYRIILNLKTFDGFLKFKHWKLGSVEDALDLITEGFYFWSAELKDASYTIPIHENYQKYLKLFWKEEYYQYIVLTNGFSSALRVFTNLLTPAFKYLRSKGHLSVKYIDDSLFLGETFEICFKIIRATVAVLWELRFTINPEKSVLVPSQQTKFLGFMINSFKMAITLTEERKKSISEYTFKLLCSNHRFSANHRSDSVLIQSFSISSSIVD